MGEADRGQLVKPGDRSLVRTSTDSLEVRAESEDAEINRLRAEIDATRLRIRESIDHLHEEVDEKLDWQRYVREHPWQIVGVAFAVGFFFGTG